MNKFAFMLGTNHSLCKVEILAVLKNKSVDYRVVAASEEVLILETDDNFKLNIDDFGSTAKLIKILKEVDYDKIFDEDILERNNLDVWLDDCDKKSVTFGISVYNGGGKFKQLNNLFYIAPKIANNFRTELKAWGMKGGYLPIKERILNTVSVDKNIFDQKGLELDLISGINKIFIGKTIAIQDYQNYSKRDYGRPERDDKSGMLPPKVAKMMINLAQGSPANNLLLDPFCGSGTVLMEAGLLGYKNLIGSDLSTRAVDDSKTNWSWLKDKYPSVRNASVKFLISDARNLSRYIDNIDLIIGEPYLGPENMMNFAKEKMQREMDNLKILYVEIFDEFSKILKKTGKMVIILPVFRYKNEFIYMDILNDLKNRGWIKQEFENNDLGLNLNERKNIVYYRAGQKVSREIVMFTRESSQKNVDRDQEKA